MAGDLTIDFKKSFDRNELRICLKVKRTKTWTKSVEYVYDLNGFTKPNPTKKTGLTMWQNELGSGMLGLVSGFRSRTCFVLF